MEVQKENKQDRFYKWLAPQISSNQLSVYYDIFSMLNKYVIDSSFLGVHLFDNYNITELKKCRNKLPQRSYGEVINGRYVKISYTQVTTALDLYIAFVEEVVLKNENRIIKGEEEENTVCNVLKRDKLLTLLSKRNVSYIDQRDKGGVLWVIGGNEISKLIMFCEAMFGAHFRFKRAGHQVTNYRPAWWTDYMSKPIDELEGKSKYQVKKVNEKSIDLSDQTNENLDFPENTKIVEADNTERYKKILNKRFKKGYRKESPIELRKFKRYWEQAYGEKIDEEDAEIEKTISQCGVSFEDKIYEVDSMVRPEMKNRIITYVQNCFEEGKSVVYYEVIFKKFSEEFFEEYIYNANMLKAYLIAVTNSQFNFARSYISKDENVEVDISSEIGSYLKEAAKPMSNDELYKLLPHIPKLKIRQILAQNEEFISNGITTYFHVNTAQISEAELENIKEIISLTIEEKSYISGNELIEVLSKKYPCIIEANSELSTIGLRDTIGYKLREDFSFKGNIISKLCQSFTMEDVFTDFCEKRDMFSIDELKLLKKELNTNIYFNIIYKNSLRISQTEFVSKKYAKFNCESTDNIIALFCIGDYIAIGSITQFGSFPDSGFTWNSYLLEHYVQSYSPNYKLLHTDFNESSCVGAIVKRNSRFDTFEDVITDVLASCKQDLEKEIALEILCSKGYLARRTYKNIEKVLIKALELRNQKGY